MSLLFIPPENKLIPAITALQILVYNVRDRDTIRAVYHIDKEVRLTCPNKLIVAPSRLLATVKRGQIAVNRDQIAAQSRHFKLASFISRLCINLKFKNWIKSFKIGSKFNFQISFRFLQNQKFLFELDQNWNSNFCFKNYIIEYPLDIPLFEASLTCLPKFLFVHFCMNIRVNSNWFQVETRPEVFLFKFWS